MTILSFIFYLPTSQATLAPPPSVNPAGVVPLSAGAPVGTAALSTLEQNRMEQDMQALRKEKERELESDMKRELARRREEMENQVDKS